MAHPPPFRFKQFVLQQEGVAHPVGTDSVLLGALAELRGARRVLDIGTGTGAIALMLAQRSAAEGAPANIMGIDLHEGSAQCALRNAAASPWKDQLLMRCISLQDFALELPESFDLVVSNPPFFSDLTFAPDETRRLGRYTGTLSPADLLESARRLLKPEGRFTVILPVAEAKRLCEMAVPMGLYWNQIVEIKSLPHKAAERWIVCFSQNPYGFKAGKLLIYSQRNVYSAAYKEVTGAFYLHF